jgi:hypothetical protein
LASRTMKTTVVALDAERILDHLGSAVSVVAVDR